MSQPITIINNNRRKLIPNYNNNDYYEEYNERSYSGFDHDHDISSNENNLESYKINDSPSSNDSIAFECNDSWNESMNDEDSLEVDESISRYDDSSILMTRYETNLISVVEKNLTKNLTLNDNNVVNNNNNNSSVEELSESSGLGSHNQLSNSSNSSLKSSRISPNNQTNLNFSPSKKLYSRRKRLRNSHSQSLTFTSQYEFLDHNSYLGKGSYACVRLAIRKKDGKKVAVKLIDKSRKENTREKCFEEIRILKKCTDTENILKMHQFIEDEKYYYIITDYKEGGDLEDKLEKRGNLSEFEVAWIIYQLAKGLKFLHDNCIAHRDIKPQNILISKRDHHVNSSICLADFDLSKIDEGNNPTDTSSWNGRYPINLPVDSSSLINPSLYSTTHPYELAAQNESKREKQPKMFMDDMVGSPEYMSPEIALRFLLDDDIQLNHYSESCDIWSLGVVMFRLLTNAAPFKALGCSDNNCRWEEGQACEECKDSLFEQICNSPLEFKQPIWKSLSMQAKHLIIRCLTKDFNLRITADEILKHPFITAVSEMEESMQEKLTLCGSTELVQSELNNEFQNNLKLQHNELNQQTFLQIQQYQDNALLLNQKIYHSNRQNFSHLSQVNGVFSRQNNGFNLNHNNFHNTSNANHTKNFNHDNPENIKKNNMRINNFNKNQHYTSSNQPMQQQQPQQPQPPQKPQMFTGHGQFQRHHHQQVQQQNQHSRLNFNLASQKQQEYHQQTQIHHPAAYFNNNFDSFHPSFSFSPPQPKKIHNVHHQQHQHQNLIQRNNHHHINQNFYGHHHHQQLQQQQHQQPQQVLPIHQLYNHQPIHQFQKNPPRFFQNQSLYQNGSPLCSHQQDNSGICKIENGLEALYIDQDSGQGIHH